MNKQQLPQETSEQYRWRLNREMTEEVIEHKKAIAAELRKAGHKVEHPEDLGGTYCGEHWEVDGHSIEVKARLQYDGTSSYAKPTGIVYITVGGYRSNRKFMKRTAANFLKKFPQGFDYESIAKKMVDWCQKDAEENEHEREAQEKSAQANAQAECVIDHLIATFGLKRPFMTGVPAPLGHDYGHETVKLEFADLTENQARAIMLAAKDCGALDRYLPCEE